MSHPDENVGDQQSEGHSAGRTSPEFNRLDSQVSDIHKWTKERFAYLLVKGCEKDSEEEVNPALVVSNAITDTTSIFTKYDRLGPLDLAIKDQWIREMNVLLAPCDLISECEDRMIEDGETGKLEKVQVKIATRSDMATHLPALQDLDKLLLEMMDSFEGADLEIKYEKSACDGSPDSKTDMWWRLIPRIPEGGLSEKLTSLLKKQHKSATQSYRIAERYNSYAIADMDMPESYTESLPKTAREVLGEGTYHHLLTVDPSKPDELVDFFNLTDELEAHKTVNNLEEAIVIWSRKASGKPAKPSWKAQVKELVTDADKNTVLANRAEAAIKLIKRRYPQLPQTTLEVSKLANNKDMGKAVLESYSRALESLAAKMVSLIERVLQAADGKPVAGGASLAERLENDSK